MKTKKVEKVEVELSSRDKILKAYIKICRLAATDPEVFKGFKSHPIYHEVLEHLSPRLGMAHLISIEKNNAWLLDVKAFWENDKFGAPNKYDFDTTHNEQEGIINCSPTTLQYISVLSNLIDNFKSLDNFSIVEIGAGYGGQCKIIRDVFDIKKYTIIDLDGVTDLQSKYLETLNCIDKVEIANSESYEQILEDEYDLAMSNYALSEVSKEDQLKYVENVLLKSKRGYITCNQDLNGIELLKEKFKTFKISPDIQGERETNYLITW